MLFRRGDVGIHPTIFPCLFHLDIPDEALFHPIVVEMEFIIGDLAALDNVSLQTHLFLVPELRESPAPLGYCILQQGASRQ